MKTRTLVTLVLCLCAARLARAQQAEPSFPLAVQPGTRVERPLAAGAAHRYRIQMEPQQYIHLEVDAIDNGVVISLRDSAERILLDREDPEGAYGPSLPLSFVAPNAGAYTLRVLGSGIPPAGGSYRLRVGELAPAGERERATVRFEELYDRATELERAEAPDSVAQAMARYGQVAAQAREGHDGAAEARALFHLGIKQMERYDFDQAEETLGRALACASETRDTALESNTRNMLAALLYQRGDMIGALGRLRQSLALAEALGYRGMLARLNNNLGTTEMHMGALEEAQAHLERARDMYRLLGSDSGGLVNALDNLAMDYGRRGDYQRALDTYRESRDVLHATGGYTGAEARNLNNVAFLLAQLGRKREALDQWERAIPLYRAAGDRRGLATALTNEAVAIADSAPALATQRFREALEQRRASKDLAGEAMTLQNLAAHYSERLGQHAAAAAMLDSALVLRRRNGEKAAIAATLESLGRVYDKMGDGDRALELVDSALAIDRDIGARRAVAATLVTRARLLAARADYARARQDLESALATWEALRRSIQASGLRESFATQFATVYELYIDVLMRQQRSDPLPRHDVEALAIAERARAHGLLETLADVRAHAHRSLDPALLAQEEALQRRIALLGRQQTGTGDAARSTGRQLDSLLMAFDELQARLRATNVRYSALDEVRPLPAAELRAQLDSGTALLEYALGAERSYLWVLTRDSIASFTLAPRRSIEDAVRRYYGNATARTSVSPRSGPAAWRQRIAAADRAQRRYGDTLEALLLAPARAQLRRERLVISGVGAIQFVPFAALPDLAHPGHAPLVARHQIIMLPSASVGALLRDRAQRRVPAPRTLQVFADPVFGPDDPRVHASAPTAASGIGAWRGMDPDLSSSARGSGAADARGTLPRLPFSAREAEALLALVPPRDGAAATGFDATLHAALDSTLASFRIIHFATHALLDDERPQLSGIVLSLVDRRGHPLDGFLRLNRLYALDLRADLVVLSACQSALGREMAGEGPVSLARGFIWAGASRVLGSLWKVQDEATAELMRRFYGHMLGREHMGPAAALRAAQLSLRAQSRWREPYFWAGFTLQGDWR